ncbi:MAG: CpaD family pilus assembly lipoprotein, partial [Bdellovibrionales bacterium]
MRLATKHIVIFGVVAALSGFLGACESIVHSDTKLSPNKVRVSEEDIFERVSSYGVDADYVAKLAQHYKRTGSGELRVTAGYDPQLKGGATAASSQLSRVVGGLRESGVDTIKSAILPVNGQGEGVVFLIAYRSYAVKAPEDCPMMAGFEDRNVDTDADYPLGCTRDTLFARQIARPQDLTGGKPHGDLSDGRRAGNVI